MKEHLPDFFGFEAVGILIYNFKSKWQSNAIANWLFTDPDFVKKEDLHAQTLEDPGDEHQPSQTQFTQEQELTLEELKEDTKEDLREEQKEEQPKQQINIGKDDKNLKLPDNFE